MAGLRNWARNYSYHAKTVHFPKTVAEVEHLVSRHARVRVQGSGHSFNGIADSEDAMVSLESMNRVVDLDLTPGGETVTVEGGIRYGELCEFLHRKGYALHNLASLPHISVAGACATATHGSGDGRSASCRAVKC